MVTYFNAFLPSHGTKNCGERVRHAAGSIWVESWPTLEMGKNPEMEVSPNG